MSTIHIGADKGAIAETVLLPGDPLRAKYASEKILKDATCYNRVRGMLGYTGSYRGKRVSIQGGGMGMGSTAIYVNELITGYGVKQIIRVGTCGAIQKDMKIGQIILAMSASGDSSANKRFFHDMHYAATADFDLLLKAYKAAEKMNIDTIQGSIFSTDTFYDDTPDRWDVWSKHGILAVEMESQILYTISKKLGAKALSILTVSDNIITGQSAPPEDREKAYMDMIKIGLEVAM